jgi:hypothetical protein
MIFFFNADADPDPAFHSNADPDPASKKNAGQHPCKNVHENKKQKPRGSTYFTAQT